MFFHKGDSIDRRPEVWNKQGELQEWVWSKLFTTVKVINNYGVRIIVHVTGYTQRGRQRAFVLEPFDRIDIQTYVSFMVTALTYDEELGQGKFINGWLINKGSLVIPVSRGGQRPKVTEGEWLKAINADEAFASTVTLWDNWADARRELLVLKTPQLVPRFTETGFKVTKMPKDLWKTLLQYRAEHNATPEYWEVGETQINQKEARCSHLDLTLRLRQEIVRGFSAIILNIYHECF